MSTRKTSQKQYSVTIVYQVAMVYLKYMHCHDYFFLEPSYCTAFEERISP